MSVVETSPAQVEESGTKPRDIFLVANNIEEMGGLMRFAHTLATLLTDRGHRVRLIGVNHPDEIFDYGSNLPYETHVLHEHRPPGAPRMRGLGRLNPARHLQRARRAAAKQAGAHRLSRLFDTGRDGGIVIVCQIYAMEWVALADTSGMRVVGMSHESFSASKASTRYGRVRRYYRQVERLYLLTQDDADKWAFDGMSNAAVMPNPLGLRAEQAAALEEKVVVSLGRFAWEKGYDMLLEAWSLVASRFPDWTLRLYGDGPDEDEMHAQAEALGINGSVEFMGRTTEVESAYLGASIYALPSRHEGMPVVLTEAMEFGVPCVAFDVSPGVREVVTDGADGILVVPGNVRRFADALGELMADAELRRSFGQHARQSMQRFAPERIIERWEREFLLLAR